MEGLQIEKNMEISTQNKIGEHFLNILTFAMIFSKVDHYDARNSTKYRFSFE